MGEGPRSVTYFGGPRFVTVCDRGSKIIKNSVTYFMDGPFTDDVILGGEGGGLGA